ncbi:ATP-dependent RNA helicase [Coemansia sp. RSA 2599]|nr:ATP-dependent RNA helicase [Coemansia sp. RSA 2598]KAJ1829287.1 ATP-dependent RNA helicase [Coemansia sp. RSA 2599]
MGSTKASVAGKGKAGNNNKRRRDSQGADKSAEEKWADTTMNPPPMPTTKPPTFLADRVEQTQATDRPTNDEGNKKKNKKKKTKRAKTAEQPKESSMEAAGEKEPIEWSWNDVSVPTHIAGADNELGGMVSFQEIDGVDCAWEEDPATGGRTLKFFKAGKQTKAKDGADRGDKPKKQKNKKREKRNSRPVITSTQDDSEDDEDGFLGAVDWDSFVAVDEFSEEKAVAGELVSIGSRMRELQQAEQEAESMAESGSDDGSQDEEDYETADDTMMDVENNAEELEAENSDDEDDHEVVDESPDASLLDVPDPDVDVSAWETYSIDASLLRALKHLGFTSPTEIQSRTLHQSLNGRDIIGAAETGSGKTLAFGIPMLQHICDNNSNGSGGMWEGPTGLVLVPTRELAVQVKNHFLALSRFMRARIAVIVGGMSVAKQERLLNSNPDVIIATPGRFWEMVSTNDQYLGHLQSVRFLAVDEADRMLQPGNFKELTHIFKAINKPSLQGSRRRRQTFVFSATLLKDMQLKKRHLSEKAKKRMKDRPEPGTMEDLMDRVGFYDKKPHFVDITSADVTAKTLTEARIDCVADEKDFYLYYFLVRYPGRTLVFVNSIDMIRRMLPIMRLLNINVFGLHAQMEQRQRLKNIDKFRDTPNAVLVASDVAARGLDIPQVEYVIHYQIPRSGDLYVHRSGRTARASQEGLAVMMVSPEERKLYYKMCAKLDKEIAPFPVDLDLVGRLKPRVKLASEIGLLEHRLNKTTHERNWFKKHAAEMDIELDSDFLPSSDDERGSEIKHSEKMDKLQIKAAKARLARLLSQKILGRGVSSQYLSSGVIGDLAERLSDKTRYNEVIPTLPKQSALETVKNKRS